MQNGSFSGVQHRGLHSHIGSFKNNSNKKIGKMRQLDDPTGVEDIIIKKETSEPIFIEKMDFINKKST